jgi:DNA topoisomerase-1
MRERVLYRYLTAKYKEKKQVRSEDGGKTTVYVYSERQIALRNRKKAERIQKLGETIKKIRAKVQKDLKSSDPETLRVALATALMDHTYERIGNDESAKDGHFGVTGWRRKHISFKPNGVFIKYTGKSGVKQHKKVTDARVRKVLREVYDSLKDDNSSLLEWEGGKITSEKVNAYLKPFEISSKDIRGFHANQEMREHLKKVRSGALPTNPKERKAQLKDEFKKALEAVAEVVGHEASTLKSQYLAPGLEESYLKDGTIIDKFGSIRLDQ